MTAPDNESRQLPRRRPRAGWRLLTDAMLVVGIVALLVAMFTPVTTPTLVIAGIAGVGCLGVAYLGGRAGRSSGGDDNAR